MATMFKNSLKHKSIKTKIHPFLLENSALRKKYQIQYLFKNT